MSNWKAGFLAAVRSFITGESPPARLAQKATSPKVDISRVNLRRVLGEENLTEAWNLRIHPVGELVNAPCKFGGVPDFIDGKEQWPRCKMCGEPMTFIGQLPVGREEPVRFPTEGRLFLFLCNSDPTSETQCETWDHSSGCSSCFVQPNAATPMPLGEGPAEREALAAAVRRNEKNTQGGESLFEGIRRKGKKAYSPYLARQYAMDFQERLLSPRMPEHASDEQLAHVCAAQEAFQIQVGGFGDWVQEPIEATCSCGAPMELLVQFDALDEVINLGDSGRAYLFGCKDRHAPDAFFLDWQCA
jgi:hypothetical protein